MKKILSTGMVMLVWMALAGQAAGHFGMLIPTDNMVMQDDPRAIGLTLSFSHPMEMIGMEMARPKVFGVSVSGNTQDLLPQLQPSRVMDHAAWQMNHALRRPGVYIFHMEPQPYWEPAEDLFIIHYTKTVVAAFGDDEGWDAELGLKTEIVPLARPFGLYAGNVFQGIVKVNGRAVPFATVEVEFYNQHKKAQAPTEYMVAQTIKADGNGVFAYAAPSPGWWGFAALNEADFKIKTAAGEEKGVEIGAVLWVRFEAWQEQ